MKGGRGGSPNPREAQGTEPKFSSSLLLSPPPKDEPKEDWIRFQWEKVCVFGEGGGRVMKAALPSPASHFPICGLWPLNSVT